MACRLLCRTRMTPTWKTLHLSLAIALTAGAAPAAQLRPSSDLLLPYFEVDLDPSGMTTLFAVGNASEKPVEVLATLRTNWGIEILDVPFTLQPDEVRTVNLRDWLRNGGGEAQPGRAVGSVTLRIQGEARDALWGDWFTVDAGGGVARGEVLVDIDRSGAHSALCRRHLLRYLSGGSFAGDTELIVWREDAGAGIRLTAEASALSEPGRPVESRQIELLALDRIAVADLGLEESFGTLRIDTADDVFIGVRHSAENRYSVALQAYCVAGPCEGKNTALGVEGILLGGQDASAPRGPLVDSGSQLDWALLISNKGQLPVSGIEVQGIDASCPASELAAGETMACTAIGTALSSPQAVAVEVTGRSSCAKVSAYGTGYYEGVLVDVFP